MALMAKMALKEFRAQKDLWAMRVNRVWMVPMDFPVLMARMALMAGTVQMAPPVPTARMARMVPTVLLVPTARMAKMARTVLLELMVRMGKMAVMGKTERAVP